MTLSRRRFNQLAVASTMAAVVPFRFVGATEDPKQRILKKIPSSGQEIAAIGMGTWIAYNVGKSAKLREARQQVTAEFFRHGGGMVDSSPMYGSAEEVFGATYRALEEPDGLFSATKVWTSSTKEGKEQIANSHRLWGVDSFDLLQVHNLVNWRAHLEILFAMKKEGKLRYVGVTTSHGRRHEDLEQILKSQPIDFVQLTYNLEDRAVEKRLLPLAKERGIAVIANRPYRGGTLIKRLQRRGETVPAWASEFSCKNWPDFLLKFIISHPAVTCAIPATSKVEHMRENMNAGTGKLPDAELRKKMVTFFEGL